MGRTRWRDYADTAVELQAIARLTQYANAGDLVLFGAYDPERDVCVCFDDQVGAHGAMGGRQFWPFLLTPRGLVPSDHSLEDPLDLHPLFARYRRPAAGPDLARHGEERRASLS